MPSDRDPTRVYEVDERIDRDHVPEFCPHCGSELTTVEREGRTRRACRPCDRVVYRNPDPGACVVVRDGDAVLLVRRGVAPDAGGWVIPGGHLEVDEHPRVAAARELEEETSIAADPAALDLVDVGLVEFGGGKYTMPVVYGVDRAVTTGTVSRGTDADAARFWSTEELRSHAAVPLERFAGAVETVLGESVTAD
ncbi:NUDIX hydrolase [Halobacteriales archaeon SW_7_68_16]|nr:MAG: NUDIX hydrolase [Halobacteriales archaeon SW_7_68_16]